jgi:flagellar hook protein FlgE
MISTTSIALSGMQAAQTQLGAAGHNIANQGTVGFRRQTVQAQPAPTGGVQVSLGRASEPGTALEEDVVGLLQAKHAFMANLAVFKTQDRMMGSLIDTTG